MTSLQTRHGPAVITIFEWAGKLGPFRIKTHCGDCDLTISILKAMMEDEFKDKDVTLEIKPWLDNFFYCIVRGTWHAPIIMVNGKKFYQFSEKEPLFDRDRLAAVVKGHFLHKKGKG